MFVLITFLVINVILPNRACCFKITHVTVNKSTYYLCTYISGSLCHSNSVLQSPANIADPSVVHGLFTIIETEYYTCGLCLALLTFIVGYVVPFHFLHISFQFSIFSYLDMHTIRKRDLFCYNLSTSFVVL